MGYNPKTGLYTIENKMLVNTAEFTRTAQYFNKHGVYTHLHPKWDKKEYIEFWQEERRRRKYGYTVGGVRITGDHYHFLNFSQLQKGVREETGYKIGFKKKIRKELGFPDFWDGHYAKYHAQETAEELGLHFIGGKSRRKGFSYTGGSDASNQLELNRGKTIILGAFDTKYLTKGDGIMTMAKNNLNFLSVNTAFKHHRLITQKEHIQLGYRPKGGSTNEYGSKAHLLAISFQNDPEAARGKDAFKIYLEELGTFPNLAETLDATLPSLEEGANTTGQLIAWGTAGSKDANWAAFERIFYNPRSFRFLAFENIWDEDGSEDGCGYFFPYWQNYSPYMDSDGNSKKEEAIAHIEQEKEIRRKSAKDAKSYNQWVAERANKPSEAFSRTNLNLFTSPELTDHINNVVKNRLYEKGVRYGQLQRAQDGLKFVTNDELAFLGNVIHPPILDVPFKPDNDNTGCVIEWFPPYRNNLGKVPKNMYRIWVDPFGIDKNNKDLTIKDSLGAIYVYERVNRYTASKGDILVACYVGRPNTLDAFNEIAIRMAEYYGGHPESILFENDRGTLKQYATTKKKEHLLAYEPDIQFDKEVAYKKTGRIYGISMQPARKARAAMWFRDWLYTSIGVDSEGNNRMNLHRIYDISLLLEIQKFNLIGNFDRLSTMFVGMFDMKEQDDKEYQPEEPNEYENDFDHFLNRSLYV